jgi:hypothetical protein
MTSTSFAELLKRRHPMLSATLDEIRRRAIEEWIHHLKPDAGSHAGFVHLRGVEHNADKMLPCVAKENFTDGEIFLLLASILLHDLGRVLPDAKVVTCPFAEEHRRRTCLDRFRKQKPQGTHACQSCSLIEKIWAILGLPDSHFAEHCALVAFWHQLTKPPGRDAPNKPCPPVSESRRYFCDTSLEPYGRLRLPLIAAILRLADEAEDSWTRAFRQHWYNLMIERGETESLVKAFRRGVQDVEFIPDGECVIMYIPKAPSPHEEWDPQILKKLANKAADTCEAFEEWGDLLKPAGIIYRYVFVDIGGRIWRVERRPGPGQDTPTDLSSPVSLRRTLENHVTESNFGPYLDTGSLQRYYDGIVRLVQGTRGYSRYRWSSIEGAIGEPLTPKVRWAIGRLGSVPGALRIVPHFGGEELDITYQNQASPRLETARQLGVKV